MKKENVKKFLQQNKRFSIVLMLELVFLVILAMASLGRAVTYELDSSNLIIRDTAVGLDEKNNFVIKGENDEESFARWIIGSESLHLPHGMYELTVNYESMLHDADQGGGNCEDQTGIIQLVSADHASAFQYNEIGLTDGRKSTSDRIWVRSVTGVDDMQVMVCFFGMGDLQLTSIGIRELTAWRLVCILGWLLAFAALDLFYIYFFTRNSYNNKRVAAGLLATILFSSLPVFTNFLFDGHDLEFHLARIWSLAEGIRNGHWVVPIQTEMVNGYGYAAPLFYGQLFLYIPAILYVMAAPLQVCYQVYVFLVNVSTCLICYYSIKNLLKDKNLAVVGAFLYTLSAYRMVNVYVRAAVGEYTAMIFFPLILYGFVKVYTEEGKKVFRGVLPIVIGLSGVLQSHLLSSEMAAFSIVALCVIKIRKTIQKDRFQALAGAALITLAVNSAFIVPFLQSMQMDIAIKGRVNRIQERGTYFLQVFGIFMPPAGSDQPGSMYQEMPITLGFALILGLGIFLLCSAKKYDWNIREDQYLRIGTVCSGFTIACIILSARFFPWNSIEDISQKLSQILSVVQFPWRYLSIGTVTCLIAAMVGIKLLNENSGGGGI